jgi:uncharacterized membrane protein YhaH (DUF805 family)
MAKWGGCNQHVSGGRRLNKTVFIALAVAVFCLANATRAAYRARVEQPRFEAEGAAYFRYTEIVADGRPIPALDRKAEWPEGLRVFRETSPAMEYFYGWIYRLLPGRKPELIAFIRFFTALFFSLAMVPVALLSARLWRSRGAGMFAALLFAVALALVARSSGFEYIRENVTFPLIMAHLCCYAAACAGGGAAMPILSGLFLFGALASWQGSQFYLVPLLFLIVVRRIVWEIGPHERTATRSLIIAITAAGAFIPFLREGRFLLSIPAALAASWFFADLLGSRFEGSGRGAKARADRRSANAKAVRTVVAVVVCAVVLIAGAVSRKHFAAYSHFFDLVVYKLRYIVKPDDPDLLPFDARAFWVGPFNSPDALNVFVFAIPLLLLLPIPCAALLKRSHSGDLGALAALVFLLVYFYLYLLMQRLLPLFGMFAVIVAGGNVPAFLPFRGMKSAVRPAFILSLLAVAVFVFQDFGWEGKRDFWRRFAKALRVPSRETFVIFPFARDVEGDMLSWIRENTEPDAVFMSLHYLSPQVLTYTARPTNLNDFFESPLVRRKAERFLRLLYSSEADLYRYCVQQSSGYLLVSAAVGCDPTKDSPLYQAGFINIPPGCAAYRLMFEPERLTAFDLVFENEMYRLFRVGQAPRERMRPRSPLFYERDLLWSMSGNIAEFYNSVMHIYALTARGRSLIARGRDRAGEDALLEALHVFYFYPAWKTLDGLYARRGRLAERERTAAFAYRYDPNRADVCLALATARVELGETSGVREIVERCLALPASPEERRRAEELLRRLEEAGR